MGALRGSFWYRMVRVGEGVRSPRLIRYAAARAVRADPARFRDSWLWDFTDGGHA